MWAFLLVLSACGLGEVGRAERRQAKKLVALRVHPPKLAKGDR
jgi:hypothetical protein